MKYKILVTFLAVMACLLSAAYAADENTTSTNAPTLPQSLGAQAGEQARELKDQAQANYAAASAKVAETSKQVEVQAQDTLKNLQQQWEEFSKQLRASADQLSQQLQKQWEDFNKSFNQPKK